MKFNKLSTLFAFAICIISFSSASMAQEKGGYDWLKQRLETTKDFTLQVINAMPEDDFDFKPSEDVRSFKAQAYHIVYSIDYFNRVFQGNAQPAWAPGDENSKSKKELAKWAIEQFDIINATILAAPNNERLTVGIISYLDHNAHHRGQMISYLRAKGITPPAYR